MFLVQDRMKCLVNSVELLVVQYINDSYYYVVVTCSWILYLSTDLAIFGYSLMNSGFPFGTMNSSSSELSSVPLFSNLGISNCLPSGSLSYKSDPKNKRRKFVVGLTHPV